ncbi:MAG: division/cell wall cluster transcriptional repressor MraZ [Acidobacteriota bacterium]|nr:MAG: division/cell wall cluster transcriptional repressor MraZ [Acidobacteriota bacterium]
MVLRGNALAKIDVQGRIKIPTAHRKVLETEFGAEVFVTSTDGESIRIYPLRKWEEIEAKLLSIQGVGLEKKRFMRVTSFYGQASSMDKQGRIVIQPHLRADTQIDGEVAIIGNLTYLEVWNKDRVKRKLETEPFTEEDEAALSEAGL